MAIKGTPLSYLLCLAVINVKINTFTRAQRSDGSDYSAEAAQNTDISSPPATVTCSTHASLPISQHSIHYKIL